MISGRGYIDFTDVVQLQHSQRPTQITTSPRRDIFTVFICVTQVCWEMQRRSLWKI